jgi:MoaA/NifB/PqqE/SkfB family radical SAM enzyme
MGVKTISLSASDPGLSGALDDLRRQSARLDLELVWNLPVPYSDLNPVALETEGIELVEGAGRAWLYVEPDGDVLPAQGANQVLGNLLRDPWNEIWRG